MESRVLEFEGGVVRGEEGAVVFGEHGEMQMEMNGEMEMEAGTIFFLPTIVGEEQLRSFTKFTHRRKILLICFRIKALSPRNLP